MKVVVFYEKPGCATNAKQKKSIREAGYFVIERDLLNNGLDKETLYDFLKDYPVHEWFNQNAPKVRDKEIDPFAYEKESALKILLEEPLLIKRPLMVIGSKKLCGFDQEQVQKLLQTEFQEEVATECSSNLHFCPKPS
jgi:nitrogenase-associated protein